MSQSLSQLYIHLIFGTKHREPFITEEVEPRLFEYLAATLKKYGCSLLEINAMPDHLHMLFRLSKNYALSKIVEELKKESSKWLKNIGVEGFTWQIGYAGFSVSASKVEATQKYIREQKKHHQTQSFKEETEIFMKEYNVLDYDPKYFWDEKN